MQSVLCTEDFPIMLALCFAIYYAQNIYAGITGSNLVWYQVARPRFNDFIHAAMFKQMTSIWYVVANACGQHLCSKPSIHTYVAS